MSRCEDYPCCGHTDGLGCNWTYSPTARAFDEEHAICDHEAGVCHVEPEVCEDYPDDCPLGGCADCRRRACDLEFGDDHDHNAEECDRILDGMSPDIPMSAMYPSYDPGFDFFEREGRPMFPNEY